jgi:hypothetical protein
MLDTMLLNVLYDTINNSKNSYTNPKLSPEGRLVLFPTLEYIVGCNSSHSILNDENNIVAT